MTIDDHIREKIKDYLLRAREAMDERHKADYGLPRPNYETALLNLERAESFVE
jgi:hypothetical protein